MAEASNNRSPPRHGKPKASPHPAQLPRVLTTAPTAPTPGPLRHVTNKRPATSCVLTNDSELRAQISTLSLIKVHGYGPTPGTPLLVGNKSGFSPGGRRLHRNSKTANGVPGATSGGKRGRSNKMKPNGAFLRPNTEPWIGPMERSVGMAQKSTPEGVPKLRITRSDPVVTIERDEFKATKARRESAARGRHLLSQLARVLQRRDLVAAAQLLKSARVEFRSAEDNEGMAEVDASLVKIKADIVMQAMNGAREARDYDRVQELMFEALHYFAILAGLGQVHRHGAECISVRRDAERNTYERFRHPRQRCRKYALEDGRSSREAAAALVLKRKYPEARARLEDARACFNWAGGADVEVRELQHVLDDVEVRENATCGDRLTEGVANKLQLFTPKEYGSLFSELSEAGAAYQVAHDREGAQVVRLVRAGLSSIQSAERSCLDLALALKTRRYSLAARHLRDAKRHVANATRGLPFVSPSLTRSTKILSPPGGLSPLDIVAELAAIDGLRDHTRSLRALEQGWLDKALQLNTSAREAFEFTARCARVTTSSNNSSVVGGGSIGESAGGSVAGGGNDGEGTRSGTERQGTPSAATEADNAHVAQGIDQKAVCGSSNQSFAPSVEELQEGEALLYKIRRATSPPTHVDGGIIPARSRDPGHPGVRHRVEDLLDEVSETEDRIVRNKALERGDRLMSLFRATVAEQPAAIPGVDKAITGPTGSKAMIRRAGDSLTPDTAADCLRLLVEAAEVYKGHGFERQAIYATRLRAEIIADRCLAQAPTLAHTSISTEAAPDADLLPGEADLSTDKKKVNQKPTPAENHGRPTTPGGGDFEAARAAAREAEDNYGRAGNAAGVLKARRMELSLKGDEVMTTVEPLLDARSYDAVLVDLGRARCLYTEAGPQGLVGLEKTEDPEGIVRAAAMRDGRRLKADAAHALRIGDVEASTKFCRQAQRCFSFVDPDELADATADVAGAARMVTQLAAGDAMVAEAEEALDCDQVSQATDRLREAKSLYHEAQLSYERLVDQVTCLLAAQPDDLEAVQKAMELQDNINGLYDSRRDGQRSIHVESRLDCLAADASLEQLGQVIDHEQLEDARVLLSSAILVYERARDGSRLSKASRISALVDLVEKTNAELRDCRYADGETLIREGITERNLLAAGSPLSLHPPDCFLFRGNGDKAAKSVVLSRARAAGNTDRITALSLLEEGKYDAAETAAASCANRFAWWASHVGDDGDFSGKERAEVIRKAEELTIKVATASAEARAQSHIEEAHCLKTAQNFTGAVKAVMAAARLFDAAGLSARAVAARAEADQTEGEALVLEAEKLHAEGMFEDILDRLDRAERLFLAALGLDSQNAVPRQDTNVLILRESSGYTYEATRTHKIPQQVQDLNQFRCRAVGDQTMQGVPPALAARDYDLALRLLSEADGHYANTRVDGEKQGGVGRWATSATLGSRDTLGLSPKEIVVKRAGQDGERLRVEAAAAIQKEKNPEKAQELLSKAETCMMWAGVDPVAAGTAAVSKDIHVFESRTAGDTICMGLINLLLCGDLKQANVMLEEALDKYRQGDAFKQIADTRAVMFCVEREDLLCSDVVAAVAGDDPAAALKVLEESRPVFEMAADMGSVVLHDVAKLMGVKHKHITALSAVCRAWSQCVIGQLPSLKEIENDTPLPAVVLEKALSELRALSTAGATALDIRLGLLEQACSATSVDSIESHESFALGDGMARSVPRELDVPTGGETRAEKGSIGSLGDSSHNVSQGAGEIAEGPQRSSGNCNSGDDPSTVPSFGKNSDDSAGYIGDFAEQDDGGAKGGNGSSKEVKRVQIDKNKSEEGRITTDSYSDFSISLDNDSDVQSDQSRRDGRDASSLSHTVAEAQQVTRVLDEHPLSPPIALPSADEIVANGPDSPGNSSLDHQESSGVEVEMNSEGAVAAAASSARKLADASDASQKVSPVAEHSTVTTTSGTDELEDGVETGVIRSSIAGYDQSTRRQIGAVDASPGTVEEGKHPEPIPRNTTVVSPSLGSARHDGHAELLGVQCAKEANGEGLLLESPTTKSTPERVTGNTGDTSMVSAQPLLPSASFLADVMDSQDVESNAESCSIGGSNEGACAAKNPDDTPETPVGSANLLARKATTPFTGAVVNQGNESQSPGRRKETRSQDATPSDDSVGLSYDLDHKLVGERSDERTPDLSEVQPDPVVRGDDEDRGHTDEGALTPPAIAASETDTQMKHVEGADFSSTEGKQHNTEGTWSHVDAPRATAVDGIHEDASAATAETADATGHINGDLSTSTVSDPVTRSVSGSEPVDDGINIGIVKHEDDVDDSTTAASSRRHTNRSSDGSYTEEYSVSSSTESAGARSRSESHSDTVSSGQNSSSETEQTNELQAATPVEDASPPLPEGRRAAGVTDSERSESSNGSVSSMLSTPSNSVPTAHDKHEEHITVDKNGDVVEHEEKPEDTATGTATIQDGKNRMGSSGGGDLEGRSTTASLVHSIDHDTSGPTFVLDLLATTTPQERCESTAPYQQDCGASGDVHEARASEFVVVGEGTTTTFEKALNDTGDSLLYKPDLAAIDTQVDAEEMQKRFVDMLSSFGVSPTTASLHSPPGETSTSCLPSIDATGISSVQQGNSSVAQYPGMKIPDDQSEKSRNQDDHQHSSTENGRVADSVIQVSAGHLVLEDDRFKTINTGKEKELQQSLSPRTATSRRLLPDNIEDGVKEGTNSFPGERASDERGETQKTGEPRASTNDQNAVDLEFTVVGSMGVGGDDPGRDVGSGTDSTSNAKQRRNSSGIGLSADAANETQYYLDEVHDKVQVGLSADFADGTEARILLTEQTPAANVSAASDTAFSAEARRPSHTQEPELRSSPRSNDTDNSATNANGGLVSASPTGAQTPATLSTNEETAAGQPQFQSATDGVVGVTESSALGISEPISWPTDNSIHESGMVGGNQIIGSNGDAGLSAYHGPIPAPALASGDDDQGVLLRPSVHDNNVESSVSAGSKIDGNERGPLSAAEVPPVDAFTLPIDATSEGSAPEYHGGRVNTTAETPHYDEIEGGADYSETRSSSLSPLESSLGDSGSAEPSTSPQQITGATADDKENLESESISNVDPKIDGTVRLDVDIITGKEATYSAVETNASSDDESESGGRVPLAILTSETEPGVRQEEPTDVAPDGMACSSVPAPSSESAISKRPVDDGEIDETEHPPEAHSTKAAEAGWDTTTGTSDSNIPARHHIDATAAPDVSTSPDIGTTSYTADQSDESDYLYDIDDDSGSSAYLVDNSGFS